MNRESQDEHPKGAAETEGKKVFRHPQLKVYGGVADLTRAVLQPKTLADGNTMAPFKSAL